MQKSVNREIQDAFEYSRDSINHTHTQQRAAAGP